MENNGKQWKTIENNNNKVVSTIGLSSDGRDHYFSL
jgi:hypothetical protein